MYTWKITKYNPIFNGSDGRYENDEWTSISDIGKTFEGKMLSLESYKLCENAYIESIHLVMKANNVTSLKIQALEKRYTHDYPDMQEKYSKSYIESLKEGEIICYADIDFLVRLILREMVWCKLIVKQSMFVHFGYDYYMYIGSKEKLVNEIEEMIRLGLFPVEMQSPYLN